MQIPELSQITHTIVMVSPDGFGYNIETAATNPYQHRPSSEKKTQANALQEFDTMVQTLRDHGITVLRLASSPTHKDAVFPNNWFSHHRTQHGDTLVLYPMGVANRRQERQPDVLLRVLPPPAQQVDLMHYENKEIFLEGTGSMVLDRINKVAYAVESPRTMRSLFDQWAEMMGYTGIFLRASDMEIPPYHTNIVMAIGEDFAVIAPDLIAKDDHEKVLSSLAKTRKEIITISSEQVAQFCGNIIQLQSQKGEQKIILSESAFRGFTAEQRKKLAQFGELVPVAIPTIENVGGGSARCMIAEIFPAAS